MSLSELEVGKKAPIKHIDTKNEEIRSRLYALGLVKGEKVEVLRHTLAKQTYEIKAGNSRIALRKEEADSVKVA